MTNKHLGLCSVSTGLLLAINASAATISVNFDGSTDSSNPNFSASSLAGAPGVRVANWNPWGNWNSDINNPPVLGGAGNPAIVDDSGATISGFTATFSGQFRTGQRQIGSGADDALFFGNQVDTWGGQESVSVSGVPYSQYDVYVYMYDDRDGRAGEFTIGSTTYFARGIGAQSGAEGVGNPLADGTGYVLSTDTTQGSSTDIDQGNYVHFQGLSGASFTLLLDAVNAGNLDRNKVAGFQIVDTTIPEPSSALLLFLSMSFGLLARRR